MPEWKGIGETLGTLLHYQQTSVENKPLLYSQSTMKEVTSSTLNLGIT